MRHAAVLLAVLALAAPARADVPAGSQSLSAGDVSATLSWSAGEFFATRPALRIERGGQTAVDVQLADECRLCDGLDDPARALHVRDLDGDGDPEVFVDAYSGGAHCCSTTPIYGWRGDHYDHVTAPWGNVGYRLRDLDGDGRPEFVSADDAFAYRFTDYADSAFPVLVFAYGTDRSGTTALRDVTAGYPSLMGSDAARQLRQVRHDRFDRRGAIAAYVADEYRLGRQATADRLLRRALRRGWLRGDGLWPRGRRYIAALRGFLRARHYLT